MKLVFNNWVSDPEVAKFMRWNKHNSIDETKEWLNFCESNKNNKEFNDWGIILKENNEPIGSIGAFINPEEPNRYEVGYAIGKKYWGQGIAREALNCMINYFINDIGIKKFIGMHSVDNPASGVVMEHIGFKSIREGSYQSMDGKIIFKSKVCYLDIN